MMWRFFLSLIFSLMAVAAMAKEPARGWSVRPVNDDAGQFSYCVAEQLYPNGTAVAIARNLLGQYNLAVTVPGGSAGNPNMQLVIEPGFTRQGTAQLDDQGLLLITLGWDEEFIQALGKGKQALLILPGSQHSFPLDGAASLGDQLNGCISRALKLPPPALSPDLADWFARAKITPLRPLALPKGATQQPIEEAWNFGRLFGGVERMDLPKGASLDDVMVAYAEALQGLCAGQFLPSLGTIRRSPAGVELAGADIACDMGEASTATALLFTHSKGKVNILFHESSAANAPQGRAVRDRLRAAVP